MTKTVQLMLRVGEQLKSKLEAEAEKHKCSEQAIIQKILSRSFKIPYSPPKVGKRKKSQEQQL